jgi:hypothetical protein
MVAIAALPAGSGNVDQGAISEGEGLRGGDQPSVDNRLLCGPLDKQRTTGFVLDGSSCQDPNPPVCSKKRRSPSKP